MKLGMTPPTSTDRPLRPAPSHVKVRARRQDTGKHFWAPGRHFLGAVLALGLGALVHAAPAQAQNATEFEVTIPVDVTAGNAIEARQKAHLRGQQDALQLLLRQMAVEEDYALLPKVGAAEVGDFVLSFSVADERTSDVRYLGDLTVVFSAADIRDLLRENKVRFAETPSQPVMVLPVLRQNRKLTLWDQSNPWLNGWASLPPRNGLVPMIVPIGDIQDINEVGGSALVLRDEKRLLKIARRYQAGDVLLTSATLGQAGGAQVADVVVDRLGNLDQPGLIKRRYTNRGRQATETFLAGVAERVATEIEEKWKALNLIAYDIEQAFVVVIPITKLQDWPTVRDRLAQTQTVRAFRQISLRKTQVQVVVEYVGSIKQLGVALSQQNLLLQRSGTAWYLVPAEAGPGAIPKATGATPARDVTNTGARETPVSEAARAG